MRIAFCGRIPFYEKVWEMTTVTAIIVGVLVFFAICALVVALLIQRAPRVEECDCDECRCLRGEFVEPAEELTDLCAATAATELLSQNKPGKVSDVKSSRCCASRAHEIPKTAQHSWFSGWKSHTPR